MLPRASTQDGSHPRPQLLRERWTDLSGTWQLGLDDARAGLRERWQRRPLAERGPFGRDVVVPYPPESSASGVGDPGPHAVLWYRRGLRLADVDGSGDLAGGARLVLRFGAVDHSASVWWDGELVATHTGGQTPFSADVTDLLERADDGGLDVDAEHVLVVRAEDDPRDPELPRGKQDWLDAPHAIWYRRTSGIWQTVWAEVVPALSVEHLTWRPDVAGATVHLDAELSGPPEALAGGPVSLAVRLVLGERLLAEQVVAVEGARVRTEIAVPALRHGQDRWDLLWSPEDPRLVDAEVRLLAGTPSAPGEELDAASSYLGLRSVAVGGGAFLLNGTPTRLRSVLNQGWWPDTHLAADAARLRAEAQLIADLGFNAVRNHQKVEDPRFLHWCDRLGIMVWGETAGAYAFTPRAVSLLAAEWAEVVRRDASHPCVVTWVPFNESWGVQDIAVDPAQRSYATALTELTRALDPSRPVISNDGWEHTDSDLWTVHDYADTGERLTARYGTPEATARVLDGGAGTGPAGRAIRLAGGSDRGQPVMLTEFGGVRFTPSLDPSSADAATWGYSTARDAGDFARRLRDLVGAAQDSPVLAGWCYTQLTDTLQEANGLVDEQRRPKLPLEVLRAIVTGSSR